MQFLKTNSIQSKNDLIAFYADQLSEASILGEIVEIQKKTKTNYKGKDVKYAKLISVKEVIAFINTYGAPTGYQLDEEMANRLKDYEREK
jgi:hypothetical protein